MQDAVWHAAFAPKIRNAAAVNLLPVATAAGAKTEDVPKKKACRTATNAKKFHVQKE